MKIYERHGQVIGRKPSRTYNAWRNMIQRCSNKKRHDFKYYGGRGITVCRRWLNAFGNFLTDMGECPFGMSLDREKNWRGYSKGNCRWATRHQQMQNTRANRLITYAGKTMGITAWSRRVGITHSSMQSRFKRGWSIKLALTQKGK